MGNECLIPSLMSLLLFASSADATCSGPGPFDQCTDYTSQNLKSGIVAPWRDAKPTNIAYTCADYDNEPGYCGYMPTSQQFSAWGTASGGAPWSPATYVSVGEVKKNVIVRNVQQPASIHPSIYLNPSLFQSPSVRIANKNP
jgi:hypothetical protein